MKAKDKESLDPRLLHALESLRPVPRRDSFAAARAKANFLAELQGLFEPDSPPQAGFLTNPARWLESLKKPLVSFNPLPRTALSFFAILLILVILLFGWASVTARAAEMSLPGDTLYTFKTGIENVQVALAGDLDKQAGLYLQFASHRLQELEQLVENGRYEKAVELSAKFRFNIQKALDITNSLAKVNPARAAQRRLEIDAQLALFTAQLDQLLAKIPASYQPAFNEVLPPLIPGISAPVPTSSTQTPAQTPVPDLPKDGETPAQNELEDGSDTDPNQGMDEDTKNEHPSGESSTDGSGSSVQEGSDGNTTLNNDPASEEEGYNENSCPRAK